MNSTKRFSLILLFFLAFCILLALGLWQLKRARVKEEMLLLYQSHQLQTPMTQQQLSQQQKPSQLYPIDIEGKFLNEKQFLLDNAFHQHQIGYHVLTPLQINETLPVVLIDRGWIPRSRDKHLPVIAPVEGKQHVKGLIYYPKRSLLLGSWEENAGVFPRIVERIDIDAMSKAIGKKIAPFIIVLDSSSRQAFIREFNPVVISPARHRAYALQWFGLAAIAAIMVVILWRHRE